jgi:hemolysin III
VQVLDPEKPRLRGVLHLYAFGVAILLGTLLVLTTEGARARISGGVFALSVAAMFGASALYHVPTWRPRPRRWLRRLDHAMIYALIAGTYTPFGLIVLSGAWQVAVLAIVWSGAAAAMLVKLAWVDSPKWLATGLGIGLGWVGVVAFPQFSRIGAVGILLLVAGGVLYTAGSIVYARRRPDPAPAVFGYHELFHALVIVAAACQYAAIAFYVLPKA